jgi:hypothetical protein
VSAEAVLKRRPGRRRGREGLAAASTTSPSGKGRVSTLNELADNRRVVGACCGAHAAGAHGVLRSVGSAAGGSVEMGQLVYDRRGRAPAAHAKRELSNDQVVGTSAGDRPTPEPAIIRRVIVDPDRKVVEKTAERPAARQGLELVVSTFVVPHLPEQNHLSSADGVEKSIRNEGRAGRPCVTIGAVAYGDHHVLPSETAELGSNPSSSRIITFRHLWPGLHWEPFLSGGQA